MDKYIFNLQLFADGGAAGGDGGAAAATAGDATGVTAPDAGVRKSRKRENPLANVQYGKKQDSEQHAAPAQEPAADQGEETFESLIKGKYKADFDAHVQGIVRNRFKANAENEAQLEAYKPLMEALGKKFNVDPTDIEGMTRAVSYDPEELEMEALQRGMSVDSLMTIKKLEAQNEKLTKEQNKSIAEQRMQAHFNQLAKDSEGLKAMYPNFDLMTEMQNPTFARLTAPGVGISVQQAYELVHMEEIKQQNAKQQALAYANSVRANGARPSENGLTGEQGAQTVKSDPNTLTAADRAEIKRRVMRGEKIAF